MTMPADKLKQEKDGVEARLIIPEDSGNGVCDDGFATIASSIRLLVASTIGAGVLSLPYAIKEAGLVLGAALLALFAMLSASSCKLLHCCMQLTGEHTYSNVAKSLAGPRFADSVDLLQALYSFGTCIGYLIIIGNELDNAFSPSPGAASVLPDVSPWLLTRGPLLAIVALVVLLPLTLQRTMNALSFTSLLAMGCMCYLAVAIVSRGTPSLSCSLAEAAAYNCVGVPGLERCEIDPRAAAAPMLTSLESCLLTCDKAAPSPLPSPLPHLHPDQLPGHHLELHLARGGSAVLLAVPLFCFSFNCQVQFIPVIKEMRDSSPRRVHWVLSGVFCFCFMMYLVVSMVGYISFCDYTAANVLDSFPAWDRVILVARVALVTTLTFSYPLYSYAIRVSLDRLIFTSAPPSHFRECCFATAVLLTSLLIAVACKDLSVVIGLTGAIGGSYLVYVVPGWLFIQASQKVHSSNPVGDQGVTMSSGLSSMKLRGLSYLMVVGGIALMLASTSSILFHWIALGD